MGLIKFFKNKFKKKEEYFEIPKEEIKEVEDINIKAKKELLKELNNIGIFPKIMYSIGNYQVDFAFPKEKIVIEIIGESIKEKNNTLKKKYSTIKSFGWKIYGFSSEDVFLKSKEIALKIKKIVNYHKKE
ncbi:MAG: DUF559 domain-containing protein [Candidatus Pacearchaeota archaeon]